MSFRVEPGRYALVGVPGDPVEVPREWLSPPAQLIVEADETSLLLEHGLVEAVLERFPEASVEGPLAWIRFDAPMGWEVVGFLARVTGELAAAGVPIGAICGYSRDHLFLGESHLGTAREVLAGLFPER